MISLRTRTLILKAILVTTDERRHKIRGHHINHTTLHIELIIPSGNANQLSISILLNHDTDNKLTGSGWGKCHEACISIYLQRRIAINLKGISVRRSP